MKFTPDETIESNVEQIKCSNQQCGIVSHTTWVMLIATKCDDPDHEGRHPRTYVRIQQCHRCGAWMEWMQVKGPEGGIVKILLTASEVVRFKAGLE